MKFIFQIINQNLDKVIYVDFGGSWCESCIRAMPASHDLRNEFKRNDVVFIYISIDENVDKWIKLCNKFELNNVHNNFIIENLYSLQDFTIIRIWRIHGDT